MPRVVITGGPGAGKTSLLGALAELGYETVGESARSVIAERLAANKSPRPKPQEFALEVLRRDIEKYGRAEESPNWVFFDRGVIEAVGWASEVSALPETEAGPTAGAYPFHPTVFALPPWHAIYVTDAERDHDFEHAVEVHKSLARWYSSCGYVLHEVPCLPVAARAKHVLHTLTSDA